MFIEWKGPGNESRSFISWSSGLEAEVGPIKTVIVSRAWVVTNAYRIKFVTILIATYVISEPCRYLFTILSDPSTSFMFEGWFMAPLQMK